MQADMHDQPCFLTFYCMISNQIQQFWLMSCHGSCMTGFARHLLCHSSFSLLFILTSLLAICSITNTLLFNLVTMKTRKIHKSVGRLVSQSVSQSVSQLVSQSVRKNILPHLRYRQHFKTENLLYPESECHTYWILLL